MSNVAIRAIGLGKRYQIKHERNREEYSTLREVVSDGLLRPWRSLGAKLGKRHGAEPNPLHVSRSTAGFGKHQTAEEFWALRDVSFEVRQGEVVGIIGRNGAGKSTLLKVLSRITEPTTGKVGMKGRVASLLEVGTGFHPELTGRENVFLNGAILGMTRDEIKRKFDEIVGFAEIDRFLDTPVKRYSSGMYVRLAFAVAAFLEPEVLIVDEVLAVGDIAFQKKCLGKMDEVSRTGKTVLMVSHIMSSIMRLCTRALLLEQGRVLFDGTSREAVDRYTKISTVPTSGRLSLADCPRPQGLPRDAVIDEAIPVSCNGAGSWTFGYQESISFKVIIEVSAPIEEFCFGIALYNAAGWEIASSLSTHDLQVRHLSPGRYALSVSYPQMGLLPGTYKIGMSIRSGRGFEDYSDSAMSIEVTPNELASRHRVETFGGVLVPQTVYSLEEA